MLVLRVVYLLESSGFRRIDVCKRRNLHVLIVLTFVFFDFINFRRLDFCICWGLQIVGVLCAVAFEGNLRGCLSASKGLPTDFLRLCSQAAS